MGCGKAIESTALEVGGAAIGGAIGGPIGAGIGAAGGSALSGGSIKQDLLAGATAGLGSSVDVGQALGLDTSISGTIENEIGNAFNSAGSALGLTGDGASAAGDTATNAAGATVNPSTGTTVSAPSATTVAAPASGGGGIASPSNLADTFASQTQSELDSGVLGGSSAPTSSPRLGSVSSPAAGSSGGNFSYNLSGNPTGAAANSAIGAAGSDAIGSTSGGGLKDFLPSKASIGNTLEKAALPLAGAAYSAIKGPAALPADARNLQAGGAATAPLLALENQGANEAITGQLTQPQQAQVLQYVQNAQNALFQQLASAGVTNPTQDSRYIAGMQKIEQDAMALQQQFITQAIQQATSAGGAASSNIASVANEQIQQDTEYQNALSAAFAALGGSIGGGGININQSKAAA